MPTFWPWPIERIDLDGWVTQWQQVRRHANGQETVIESVLCTIIAMTHEAEAVQYVDTMQIILNGIAEGRSVVEIQIAIHNRCPHTPQHLPGVAALCSRFKPARPQLQQGLIVIDRVTPDTMPTYDLARPSRVVVFVSHAGLQELLFGHSASDACTRWVGTHDMAMVLDRMILNRPDFPPVEVALFTGCREALLEGRRPAQSSAAHHLL